MSTGSTAAAIKAGDQLLAELTSAPARPSHAPTMGRLQKVSYTHADMIDFIIQNPTASQGQIAARYGYTEGWVSNVLASEAFQASMAARKDEIIDPAIKATIEERFKALVIRSHEVLMKKLEQPQVSDNVALRALELGARALGIGGNAPAAPVAPRTDRLVILAERLVDLQANIRQGRTYDGEGIREVEADGVKRLQESELRGVPGSGSDARPAAEGPGAAEADAGRAG